MKFKEAYLRLKEIHQQLTDDSLIDIEEILALQHEAKKCYDTCNALLKKQESEIAVE